MTTLHPMYNNREHNSPGGTKERAAVQKLCDNVYKISLGGWSFGCGRIVWVQSLFFSKTKPKVEKEANYFPLNCNQL